MGIASDIERLCKAGPLRHKDTGYFTATPLERAVIEALLLVSV